MQLVLFLSLVTADHSPFTPTELSVKTRQDVVSLSINALCVSRKEIRQDFNHLVTRHWPGVWDIVSRASMMIQAMLAQLLEWPQLWIYPLSSGL